MKASTTNAVAFEWEAGTGRLGVLVCDLDAGDFGAYITQYDPSKYPTTALFAAHYEEDHGQEVPKGTAWIANTHKIDEYGYGSDYRTTAHTSLEEAKKACERAIKSAIQGGE